MPAALDLDLVHLALVEAAPAAPASGPEPDPASELGLVLLALVPEHLVPDLVPEPESEPQPQPGLEAHTDCEALTETEKAA